MYVFYVSHYVICITPLRHCKILLLSEMTKIDISLFSLFLFKTKIPGTR